MHDEREPPTSGSRLALAFCLKLLLLITSSRSTADEPHFPNVVDNSFEMEHRIPCRMDGTLSARLGYMNTSSASLDRIIDPTQLAPTTHSTALEIQTLLILPAQLSRPEFICKVLEDPHLSMQYRQTRLDYTKRAIVLESFRVAFDASSRVGSGLSPLSSGTFPNSSKDYRERITFFQDLSSFLDSLPTRGVCTKLKGAKRGRMEVMVSINNSSRNDVLMIDGPCSVCLFPPWKDSGGECLSLTTKSLNMSSLQSLLDSLHSLLAAIPQPVQVNPPLYLGIAFPFWPLEYNIPRKPTAKASAARVSYKRLFFRLPTLFESRPPSPIIIMPPPPSSPKPHIPSISEPSRLSSVVRSQHRVPRLDLEVLTRETRELAETVTIGTYSPRSVSTRSVSLRTHRSSLVFDIRRSSLETVSRTSSTFETCSWIYLPNRSSLDVDGMSITRASSISSVLYPSKSDADADLYTTLNIFRCLAKNGYTLQADADLYTTFDIFRCLAKNGYTLHVPGYDDYMVSSAEFPNLGQDDGMRVSISSDASRSYATAHSEVESITAPSLESNIRQSASSSRTTIISYFTANDSRLSPTSKLTSNTDSFYSAAASFMEDNSLLAPILNEVDPSAVLTPAAGSSSIPAHHHTHGNHSMSHRQLSIHHTHEYNQTYHFQFNFQGDSFHGPIFGGAVGGRNNSNVMTNVGSTASMLVSEIEAILRAIRSHGPGAETEGVDGP